MKRDRKVKRESSEYPKPRKGRQKFPRPKGAEQTLRQPKAKPLKLYEDMKDGFVYIDMKGGIRDCNESYQKMLGYSLEELTRLTDIELTPEKWRAFEKRIVEEQILSNGVSDVYEKEYRKKDGTIFPVEVRAFGVKNEAGKNKGMWAIVRDMTDRKRAEETQKEAIRIVHKSPAVAFLWKNEKGWPVSFVSDNAATVFGYASEDFMGGKVTFAEIIHPEDLERVGHEVARFSAEEGRTEFVHEPYRIIDRAGRVKWLDDRTGIRRDEHGKITHYEGIVLDITERMQKEEALRVSEEKYRIITNHTTDVITVLDMNLRFTYVSPSILRIRGFTVEEAMAQTLDQVVTPKSLQSIRKIFEEEMKLEGSGTADLGRVRMIELEEYRKDGSTIWVEVSLSFLRDKDQKPVGILSVSRDMTDRKRSEQALTESERRFRAIFDQAGVGVAEIDSVTGRFLAVNQKYCEIVGYTHHEMLTLSFSDLTHPDDLQLDLDNMQRLLHGKISTFTMEKRYYRKNGDIIWVHLTVSPLWDYNDTLKEPTHLAIVSDITERKRAEKDMAALQEQLRQSQKMEAIGQLAGGIAHDFNNILAVILGTAQLSLVDLHEGDPLKANLEEIKRASDRGSDLTKQLLSFSRKQILETKVLDLNQVLQRLDKMLRRIIGHGISLEIISAEPICKVKADPGQMEQVIMNLSVNARDAMLGGGKLTIETACVELDQAYARRHLGVKPGSYVMLSVSDTGKGMTPEIKERIFEPFFTTKEIGQGTGLGLSTVYGIVKQSGGNIWVYSEPNQGTTFNIYLPKVDEPLDEWREEVIKEIPYGSETILVVEDEEAVRKLTVRLLKKQGYKVLEAPDGGQAFILCEKYHEPIHLILSDVVMPGMSGRELVERLQKIHPEAKGLYMSGHMENTIVHQGISEPGIHFIRKPFTVENLARKVRDVLDR